MMKVKALLGGECLKKNLLFSILKVSFFLKDSELCLDFENSSILCFNFKDVYDLRDFVYHSLLFPSVFQSIGLIEKKEFFELINFDLLKRDFYYDFFQKYSFFDLDLIIWSIYFEIDKDLKDVRNVKGLKFLDPFSVDGIPFLELIRRIESIPVNLNRRFSIPFLKKFQSVDVLNFSIPRNFKNKYYSFSVADSFFKVLKNNNEVLGSPLFFNKRGVDWLDVKFKSEEVDYSFLFLSKKLFSISSFDLDCIFYMLEFVSKITFAVIESDFSMNVFDSSLRKYNLKRSLILKTERYSLFKVYK